MGAALRRALVGVGCCLVGLAVSPALAVGEGIPSEIGPRGEQTGSSLSSLEGALINEAEHLQSQVEARGSSPSPEELPSETLSSSVASPVEGSSPAEGTGPSPLEGRLLLPAGLPTIDAEQAEAERQAKLASPEAVAAREESELKYAGLNGGEAAKVARETFTQVMEEPAGGPPKLPAGENITHFPAANIAQIEGPGGKHSAIESTAPMAVQTTHGLIPIDLSLTEEGDAFVSKTPLVDIQIPKQLGQGVSLADTGVSLTPVNEQGTSLGGSEGSIDGVTVMYPNTQTDTDTLVKPTTSGFDMDTVLRSIDSPTELNYKVTMPQGASLVEEGSAGSVSVVDVGTIVARILAPVARDAEGTLVPLSVKVTSGDIISVTLESFADGNYKLPIVVDPEAEDPVWSNGYYNYRTEWYFNRNGPNFNAPEHPSGGSWTELISNDHSSEEWGGLFYTTRGESQITRAHVEGHWNDSGSHIANYVVLYVPKSPYTEDYDPMPEATEEGRGWGGYACKPALSCPETIAGGAAPENNNTVGYEQESFGAGEGHWGENTLTNGYVDISQEKGPELEFNTTSSTIYNSQTKEYVPNVLYGSGGWLGPHHGAFEVRAKDPGIGLSLYRVGTYGWSDNKYYYDDEECEGIQCPSYNDQGYTYKTGMSNGEDSFEALAEDYVGLYKDIYPEKIKVDSSPPHNLKVVGLQNGNELPMGEPHLKIEASDGEGATKSSGIKSITVSVDGHEVNGSTASCSEGPCTASSEITLAARDYTPGTHSLIVTATDNANNVAQEELTFRVHAPSPVAIGPGEVDPTYGEFSLNASDVSLGALSGVSRTYESRTPTAGANGPLGPQWTISLGAGEGLTALANGNMVLKADGASTTFTRNTKGEYESPNNSGSLKLEAKEKESGKGISEYILSDAATGSKTKFEQPSEAATLTPTFGSRFSAEAGQLKHPISDAVDSAGDVWTVSNESDLVEKFSPEGILVETYGSEGTGAGQYIGPWGIAIDPRNGNVYVSDQGNNRVEELSSGGTFIKAFGWGVNKTGKDEFEICTSECKAGLAGSGNGQFSTIAGVAVDSSGNVWVADFGNNRIEEFNEKGEYLKKFGSKGTGSEQFEGPTDIALSGGNLYITDYRNNRVQEFSTAGTHVGQIGEAGSENGKFSSPYGIAADPSTGNVYVVDSGNHRVQEFAPGRVFITKFGSSGTGQGQFTTPQGVAVSSSGRIYVVDNGSNLVNEWARPSWFPVESGGPLASTSTTYTYTAVEEEEKVVAEPKEALAPIPAGVSSCTPLVAGCRALTFEYAKETIATGENPTEWGSYKGHLEKVWFHGYSTALKEVTKVEVARYEYDSKGRLRSEWDPRLAHPLKTTYGYDAEGHLTSLTPPGQQPWTLVYGTVAGDSNTGRLMKVTRAHPKTSWSETEVKEKLKEQTLLTKNTEAPKITGTPAVGVRLAASNGAWTDSPVVYGYQWEDCNTSGGECAPILGATNQNYTPVSTDVGHKLLVNVTAINGGGAVAASSAASTTVISKVGMFEQTIDSGHSVNAVSCIPSTTDCVLSDSAGKAIYATNVSTSAEATWKTWNGPSGESPSQAIDCPTASLCLLADGKETAGGKLYYATSLGGSFSEAYSPSYGVDTISCASASLCVDGQDGLGYFRYSTSPASTSWTLEYQGEAAMKGVFCLSSSFCAMVDSNGRVHVATSTGQIESSSWKETDVDGSTALNGIACTSTTSCVAVDSSGNAIKLTIESSGTATAAKHDIDGTTDLTAVTCTGSSTCVAVDNAGNVFVSKNSGESWTKEYILSDKLTSVSCASSSLCVTADTSGNVIAFNPAGGTGTEGESHAPQPGATIEYAIPASGTGSPYNLSEEEVKKWAQTDDPVEGVAIFPPDEPQTWPASSYKRATVRYWDAHGRTVNTATPTGGITTGEYDEADETVRTLSADNRAAALKEGCKSVAKKECLSAEVSEKLDTKNEYNKEESGIAKETNLLKVTGPEHKVKLSTGEEVEARPVTHNFYNEGSREAEEKYNEEYDLLTKTTSAALLGDGEEKDVRTSTTSYGGQGNLGWKLRKPTSTTVEPGGLDLKQTTLYDPSTGDVVETGSPGTKEAHYLSQFGSTNVFSPYAVAMSSGGNLWVVNSSGDNVDEFSSAGKYIGQFGTKGSGTGQLDEPKGIAIDSSGHIWVVDSGNDRVEEFSSEGKYVSQLGSAGSENGKLAQPIGIAIDTKGDIWVTDTANSRVEEFNSEGKYLSKFGIYGTGNGDFQEPRGIAIDSKGNLWVTDAGNSRVEEFSSEGTYLTKFGTKGTKEGQLKEPDAVGVTSEGDIAVLDTGNSRVEEFSPEGAYLSKFGSSGKGNGRLKRPTGMAIDATGNFWIADNQNRRIEEFTSKGAYGSQFYTQEAEASEGLTLAGPRGIASDTHGNLWVVDAVNDHIDKISPLGTLLAKYGSKGSEEGQLNNPNGIALDSKGNLWVVDEGNNRVEEFNPEGKYVAAFGSYGSGNGQFDSPKDIAIDAKGDLWVTDEENDRIEEFSAEGKYLSQFGTSGNGTGQFKWPTGITIDPNGNLWVLDTGNSRIEEFNPEGKFLFQIKLEEHELAGWPTGIVYAKGDLWVTDEEYDSVTEITPEGRYAAELTTEGEKPAGATVDPEGNLWITNFRSGSVAKFSTPGAHRTQIIYYTATENSQYSNCGGHPEWAGLVCRTQPTLQPEGALPELPVTTVASYNLWDDAEVTEEKFGSGSKNVTRTEKQTYDPAGRALTSEEIASPANGTALPTVTNEYNTETGGLEKQSATISGSTKTITTKSNTLGQLVEYTDAEGNVAKYTYEEGGDGRLNEITEGKGEEAKSSQKYTYNTTTGSLEKLEDSAAGTFTANYDVEGKMISEIYPNGMCANTAYNSIGEATSLEYLKTRNCAEKEAPVWFSDSVVPSIYGETLQQTSTLAKEKFKYDNAGRLTEAQETPVGKGCTSRLYAYDEESNRTSLTTRESATETCATEGGTVQSHSYDSANRLIDGGVEYETFGNVTKLPAADAGEHAVVSTYYVDNQVATQTQNEQLDKYIYDPAGNVMETVSENEKTKVKSTVISHYAGGELSWTCQEEGKAECADGKGKWTRSIVGLEGGLVAVDEAGKSPILQLRDLQGNIVATAEDNESATKVISTYNSTEFGVPQRGTTPPKYAWLGANGLSTEPSQAAGTSTNGGDSYIPEIGRALQTEPIESPGEFPNGTGGVGRVEAPYLGAANGQLKELAVREGVAREEAKKKEAEERAKLTERPASETHVDGPGEGNCETNCEINEEEEGEESIEITVNEPSEFSGARASLGKPIIECNLQADHPHKSSHVPGTINFEVWIQCTDSVLNLRLRAVLFKNGSKVAETGYVSKGDTAYGKVNVAVSCESGVYQGWGYADYELGPDYDPPSRKQSGWGAKVTIKCD
ncbi:MAG TPA: 6-bladed beta-propeller [Solirubrobacteraceae bacterium]|nr:6-bladed beta-propeller [Solirubrobacteraceae bacterium]